MVEVKGKILSNIRVAPGHYRMVLEAAGVAKDARPGQFLHIRCGPSYDPLLRRPFSIHRINGSSVEILYKVVGKGTEVLAGRHPDEELSIVGPLGNGFSIEEAIDTDILVAGGVGIASLVALAERLVYSPQSTVHSKKKVYLLIGARTKELILYEKELQRLGIEARAATEDGSYGQKGMVTGLLRDLLSTVEPRQSIIYACGPKDMLKEVAQISKSFDIRTQASLEEHMGCGLGACLGCVIKVKSEKLNLRPSAVTPFVYKRVCRDGPIFNLDEIVWDGA